jgi:hypothetical protein
MAFLLLQSRYVSQCNVSRPNDPRITRAAGTAMCPGQKPTSKRGCALIPAAESRVEWMRVLGARSLRTTKPTGERKPTSRTG